MADPLSPLAPFPYPAGEQPRWLEAGYMLAELTTLTNNPDGHAAANAHMTRFQVMENHSSDIAGMRACFNGTSACQIYHQPMAGLQAAYRG